MTLRLWTGRYQTFNPNYGVPVRTTVGAPRFKLGYELVARSSPIAPYGLFGKGLEPPQFIEKYVARLEKTGYPGMRTHLETIAHDHGDDRLVLLCYEDVAAGGFCHRRIFADWWTSYSGEAVPELVDAVGTLLQPESVALPARPGTGLGSSIPICHGNGAPKPRSDLIGAPSLSHSPASTWANGRKPFRPTLLPSLRLCQSTYMDSRRPKEGRDGKQDQRSLTERREHHLHRVRRRKGSDVLHVSGVQVPARPE